MNAPKSGNGQGKNQSGADDLKIPTLGAAPAATSPIVQPGEEPSVTEAPQAQRFDGEANTAMPTLASAVKFQDQGVPAIEVDPVEADRMEAVEKAQGPKLAADAPVSRSEFNDFMTRMENVVSALAHNTPVMQRRDQDQQAEVPRMSLEMPIDRDLDTMRRPDRRIEGVDIDVFKSMDHAAQLAFLEEPVMVNIAETNEPGAENPVVLWVNGRSAVFPRGQDMICRRKYVELLLRAKPEGINTRITRDGDGNVKNHIDKTRSLKYPFSIVRDDNPKGQAWARKIRSEA